jgi:hypothetical protein
MPEDGIVAMARHNPARLGHLIGGRSSPVCDCEHLLGTARLVTREWDFFGSFAARQRAAPAYR